LNAACVRWKQNRTLQINEAKHQHIRKTIQKFNSMALYFVSGKKRLPTDRQKARGNDSQDWQVVLCQIIGRETVRGFQSSNMFVKNPSCPNSIFPIGNPSLPNIVFHFHPFRELWAGSCAHRYYSFPICVVPVKGGYVAGEVVKSKKAKKAKSKSDCLRDHVNQSHHSSSVNFLIRLMLNIMTRRPTVTMTSKTNPNQPNTMAEDPTPLLTLPLPMSWAMVLAATEAVCCHSTDTSTKTEETKISASAAWDTGRDGKGLTSRSDPESSSSSCQPGKVARRMKQKNARMTATILFLD
jgi:hypothetical protein